MPLTSVNVLDVCPWHVHTSHSERERESSRPPLLSPPSPPGRRDKFQSRRRYEEEKTVKKKKRKKKKEGREKEGREGFPASGKVQQIPPTPAPFLSWARL